MLEIHLSTQYFVLENMLSPFLMLPVTFMYYLNLTDVYLWGHLFYLTKVQAVKENVVANHCNVKLFFKSLCLC